MNLPEVETTSPATSEDEEESNVNEEESGGRRRRFCIERRQEYRPKNKRCRIDVVIRDRMSGFNRNTGRRRTRVYTEPTLSHIVPLMTTSQPQPRPASLQEPARKPVIFINPNFIKRFIEKSIELNSSRNMPQTSRSHIKTDNPYQLSNISTATTSCLGDNINLRNSSKESLQAAATMAVVRLVAECIEDPRYRDEKLNKELVARLIEAIFKCT